MFTGGVRRRYEVVVAPQPTSCEALVKAGAGEADSVLLLGGAAGLSKHEQDACVVTAILQVSSAGSGGAWDVQRQWCWFQWRCGDCGTESADSNVVAQQTAPAFVPTHVAKVAKS
jgi:hypothetical protein